MIVEHNDIKDEVLQYYHTGGGKTYYCGFKNLAQYYSIKEGGCTDWTGYAQSGKTELLLEILRNCSMWYGHKHLIHMPDAGSVPEIIGKLIHKMSGKSFDKFYYNKDGYKVEIDNRVTEEEIYRWLPEVLEYFKIFRPKRASKGTTPKQFWDYAVANKKKLGIFSAVIDSWNYMHHDTDGFQREDKWLESTLSYRNELAEQSNLHFHTIIHPTKAKKDKNGNILCPDMHDLKGGSEWSNNGKTIIIVHREFGSKVTDVKIDKAKPKVVGVRGMCCLQYDINQASYFELTGDKGQKKYAEKEEERQIELTKIVDDEPF